MKTGLPYQDLGSDYFDRLHPEKTARRLVQRLERLGLSVQITTTPETHFGDIAPVQGIPGRCREAVLFQLHLERVHRNQRIAPDDIAAGELQTIL